MRVAFVITRLDDLGGAQVHVRDVSSSLVARGHQALVLGGSPGIVAAQLRERGVEVCAIGELRRQLDPLRDIVAVRRLRGALAGFGPDLVSTHSSKAGVLGRIAGASLGLPTLYTAHGWNFAFAQSAIGRALCAAAERLASRLARRIVTVCDADRLAAVRLRIADGSRLTTIHNGMPRVDPSLVARPERSPPRLAMVARFVPAKDHALLLRSLAPLRGLDWEVELLGDGPTLEPTRELARRLGLAERVRLPGRCLAIPERLRDAHIFVLASRWEGFPRSVLEAMRAGLPVVASDVGGIREAVVDGRTGFVVPVGDERALRERLRVLIARPELRGELGEAGRLRFEGRFTLEHLLERTFGLYEEVLTEAGSAVARGVEAGRVASQAG